MITTTSTVAIADGTISRYAAPRIAVLPTFVSSRTLVTCLLSALDSSGNLIGEARIEIEGADVDATAPASLGVVAPFQEACELAVKDYLEGLTANAGATFTIV